MFSKNKNYNKAFTLIELLVVVAIIGILSGVVLASLNTARTKGQIASIKSNLKNMIAEAELYYSDNGSYSTATNGDLDKFIIAIANNGGTAKYYSLDGRRWGASSKLNSNATKNYTVDQNGVTEWDVTYNPDTSMTWDNANTFCANRGARLPSLEQLKALSLVYGSSTPTTASFVATLYWTNTVSPTSSSGAYVVNMTDGEIYTYSKTYGYYVRCVH